MIRDQTMRLEVAYKTLKTVENYSSAPKRGLGCLQELVADPVGVGGGGAFRFRLSRLLSEGLDPPPGGGRLWKVPTVRL